MTRFRIWVWLTLLALVLAVGLSAINVWRLWTFRVAAPLDMAYYNQQLWAMWRGTPAVTVRPQNAYAVEGPQPWRTNHLRPITWLFVPAYGLIPRPELLYVIQAVVLGCGVIPAYRLGLKNGGPRGGWYAACFYATCPPLWLLGGTDFRYMYLGIPVGLWFAEKLQCRHVPGVVATGLLWATIREPYSIVAAAFGTGEVMPGLWDRRRLRTGLLAITLGVAWFWAHVLYLAAAYGAETAARYLWAVRHPVEAYGMVEGAVVQTLLREWPRLLANFTPLVLACLFVPRFLVVGLPLLFPPMRMGLFTLHPAVQFVRYASPAVVVLLAGACLSMGRLSANGKRIARLSCRTLLAINLCCLLLVLVVGPNWLGGQTAIPDAMLRLPQRLDEGRRTAELTQVLARIPRQDGVLAARSVLANLMPRDTLYDYYQPGPGLTWKDVIEECQWVVAEKRLILLDAPGLLPAQREAVLQSLLRVAGATGVRDRKTWLELARHLRAWRDSSEWKVIYSGRSTLVLRRDR